MQCQRMHHFKMTLTMSLSQKRKQQLHRNCLFDLYISILEKLHTLRLIHLRSLLLFFILKTIAYVCMIFSLLSFSFFFSNFLFVLYFQGGKISFISLSFYSFEFFSSIFIIVRAISVMDLLRTIYFSILFCTRQYDSLVLDFILLSFFL